jgi:hypothetical protein
MAKYISNGVYFHVSRNLAYNAYPQIRLGDELTIGPETNPFFGFYETVRQYPVATPSGTVLVPAIRFLKHVQRGEIPPPPALPTLP